MEKRFNQREAQFTLEFLGELCYVLYQTLGSENEFYNWLTYLEGVAYERAERYGPYVAGPTND